MHLLPQDYNSKKGNFNKYNLLKAKDALPHSAKRPQDIKWQFVYLRIESRNVYAQVSDLHSDSDEA